MNTKPDFEIVPLQSAYSAAAAALIANAFGKSLRTAQQTVEYLLTGNRRLERRAAFAAVAEGKLLGLVTCSRDKDLDPGAATIPALAVDPACRGQGIGHRLMHVAENFVRTEWLRNAGGIIRLRDGTKSANPSSHFYEDQGYVPDKTYEDCMRGGEPILIKHVAPGEAAP